MARQDINLGTAPTGAGGDTTRSTGVKINAMMTELYARNAQLGTASNANIGSSQGQVMTVGLGGLYGSPASVPVPADLYNMNRRSLEVGQYGMVGGARIPGAQSDYGLAIGIQGSNQEWRHILQFSTAGDVYDLSITNPASGGDWKIAKFYTTLNTTKAADGTLKAI